MKRAYNKPDILFEDFSLNTNIAAGCEKIPSNQADGCGVRWGNLFIFTDNLVSCTVKIVEGQSNPYYNELCYHNPTQEFNVFYS